MKVYPAPWAAAFLAVLLAGCAGGATRFYTVEASPPTQAAHTFGGAAIRVDAVHVPPALDRSELIRDGQDGQVVVSDDDHWIAPVGELIRRALTEDLMTRLPPGAVVFPDSPKPPIAQGVVVDILALSNRDGALAMEASWTLIAPPQTRPGAVPPAPRPHVVRLSTPLSATGVAGQASAISLLVAQLADHIAADLAAANPG